MDNAPRGTPDQPDGADAGGLSAPPKTPSDDGARVDIRPPVGAAPSAERDEVLFHGSVSLWLGWRAMAGAVAAVAVGLGFWIFGLVSGGNWSPAGVYLGLPLALAGALMFGYVYVSLRCLRYKITNRLIERERGILVKRVDSLDLSRVKDVQLVQNLMERMLRIGTIEILSSDRSDPLMRIEAIAAPRPVYEKLRDAVIRISQKRGVIAMDR